jgi:hypothetical protein
MKMKIIGLLLCILIISIIVVPVTAITEKQGISGITNDVDVPIWEVDDEWTYDFILSCSFMVNYSLTGDFTFKVVEDTGDSYVLEAKTRPNGYFNLGSFGLKATRFTSMSMILHIRKADLALENYMYQLKGFLFLTIGPITLPIPIQVEGNSFAEFDPSWSIIPFPLYDGKSGMLNGTEILQNNYMGLFWGLISVYGPMNISYPYTPLPYTCTGEKITVKAGTFDAYNVSAEWTDGSRFVSYFSKEVENVVKQVILRPYGGGKVQYYLLLELKDWSV